MLFFENIYYVNSPQKLIKINCKQRIIRHMKLMTQVSRVNILGGKYFQIVKNSFYPKCI